MPPSPDVSVLVPVLNEAKVIEETTAAMRGQAFDGDVEVIFIDGGSEDGTRTVLEELARSDSAIRVFDNPERWIPQALNIGLREARGEFVARMDAHTLYPPGYLAAGVERLERGGVDWVSGPQLAYGRDRLTRAVALALRTRLGVGGARFRYPVDHETEVDSGFTGVWRRATLEKLGGWDEGWRVNEDGELAARVTADGGRIVCIPEMAAQYAPPGSLLALARQYWRYGQYRAKTSRHHPHSMRLTHLVAPLLATIAVAAIAGAQRLRGPARAMMGVYGATLAGESARHAAGGQASEAVLLPAVYATMHLSWGVAFWIGSARFGPPVEAVKHALRNP